MTIEIAGMLLLLGILMWVVWLYDKEKKRAEDLEWDNSLLREKLSGRRLESDE